MNKITILTLFFLFLLAACTQDLPPNPGVPGSATPIGKATGAFEGYAEPASLQLTADEIIFSVDDMQKDVDVSVTGEQVVYKFGYVLDLLTNSWKQFEFDESPVALTKWIKGDATKTLTIQKNDLGIDVDQTGTLFVIAYACSKVENAWSCHENKWMITDFKAKLNAAAQETTQTEPPAGAPTVDTDNDGVDDSLDTDDDGDDVLDSVDAFPTNAAETIDTDNDGTGNNEDLDDDGDGVDDSIDAFPLDKAEALDTDSDGIGNDADTDDDNDNVLDATDAFTLDATESVDTDGDGIGNNADTDDDGDEIPDASDSFPLDAAENTDTDNDGIGNVADPDDDNDGVADATDAFQTNPAETIDTDNDGAGNNEDPDDDNDGAPDVDDAFPLDPNEVLDTDSDGVGNNADTNDDNDAIPDSSDAFPQDSTETIDTDSDGTGNNADTDDDNDGVADSVDEFPLDSTKSVSCVPNWQCGPWGACTSANTYTRMCTDQNNCGSSENKPDTTRSCTYIASTTQCWDNDGGKNINMKGVTCDITSFPANGYPYCNADVCNGNSVFENFCDTNSKRNTMTIACPSGEVCDTGVCVPIGSCANECSTVGQKQCGGPTEYQTCGQYDADSCLEWGTTTLCTSGQSCSNGNCIAPTCSDGIKNQAETDIDCGGPCTKCGISKTCTSDASCVSNNCVSGVCQNYCVDSDGGNAPFTASQAVLYYVKGGPASMTVTDSCGANGIPNGLNEAGCANNVGGATYLQGYYNYCANGCSNGVCAADQYHNMAACSDTDGGQNYAVAGHVRVGNVPTYYDTCQGTNNILEYYCNGNSPNQVSTSCAFGCSNGACIQTGTWQYSSSQTIASTGCSSNTCGGAAGTNTFATSCTSKGATCQTNVFVSGPPSQCRVSTYTCV